MHYEEVFALRRFNCILNQEDNIIVEILLRGSLKFDLSHSCRLLSSTLCYILKSKRLVSRFYHRVMVVLFC